MSTTIDRKYYPCVVDLEEWLTDNAQCYATRSSRMKFVKFDETVVGVHHLLNYPSVTLKYRVLDAAGATFVYGSFSNIHPDHDYTILQVEERMYAAFELHRDDFDSVARVNAARQQIYRTVSEMCDVITDLEKGKRHMKYFYNEYVRPYVKQLTLHFYRSKSGQKLKREISEGFFKSNLQRFSFVRKTKSRDVDSMSGMSSTESFQSFSTYQCECGLVPCGCIKPFKPFANVCKDDQKVGRRTTASDLEKYDRSDLRKQELAKVESLSDIKRDVTVADNDNDDDVIDDAPCFRVVNSNIRSVEGFARMHIGDSPPPGFKGKLITEKPIGEMCFDIKLACREWQIKGVRGVLLSGAMWTNKSQHSGAVLNSALPKAFDGMIVRVISCAKYADSMAAQVRNFHCILEQPNTSAITDIVAEGPSEELEDTPETVLTVEVTEDPDVLVIQTAYDVSFPKDFSVDQRMKSVEFHNTLHGIKMPELNLRAPITEDVLVQDPTDTPYMEPVVQTHMEYKHPVSQKELVYSVYNRSYMPQKEFAAVSSLRAAENLFEEFLDSMAREPKYLKVSDADRSRYLQKRGQAAVHDLRRLMDELPMRPDSWYALVKGTAKPTLEDGSASRYTPTQTIVCKDKLYNHKFGPELTKIKDFIMNNLKPEYFIYSESDVPTFEAKLSRNMHRMSGQCLEIDMSKYDKSQGWTSLFFEMYIMAYFGMSNELIFEWFDSHWLTRIKSMTGPTAFTLPAQRKSGDPWTYYGNTLYLMCTLKSAMRSSAQHYDRRFKINYMMLSGDDSLVWSEASSMEQQLICDSLASDYSLDAKLIVSNIRYFCSRFLLVVHGRIHLVPDPVKSLIKIGRRDVLDRGHMEDMRVSLIDHIDSFKYVEIRCATAQAVKDRYGFIMFEEVMEHLYSFAISREKFSSLFSDAVNATEFAVLVPYQSSRWNTTKAVWHDSLIRKSMVSMDSYERESYMRAIGANVKRKVLITYDYKYVPQGFKVLNDLREDFSFKFLKEVVYTHSRK